MGERTEQVKEYFRNNPDWVDINTVSKALNVNSQGIGPVLGQLVRAGFLDRAHEVTPYQYRLKEYGKVQAQALMPKSNGLDHMTITQIRDRLAQLEDAFEEMRRILDEIQT
jgi:hypothetical protein